MCNNMCVCIVGATNRFRPTKNNEMYSRKWIKHQKTPHTLKTLIAFIN